MMINCIWEHNKSDTLLFAEEYPGAFTRGETKELAFGKMPAEIISYCCWCERPVPKIIDLKIIQESQSQLDIADADTEVIFDSETGLISQQEYFELKNLCLKSANDFLTLYNSMPDKNKSCQPNRKTFYGDAPVTAFEMYEHTKNVNDYYFGEIGVKADNKGTILECRQRAFEILEGYDNYLENKVFNGSYNEQWSLKKLLRRFIWHDRIHAKAMYRMAKKTFCSDDIINPFCF